MFCLRSTLPATRPAIAVTVISTIGAGALASSGGSDLAGPLGLAAALVILGLAWLGLRRDVHSSGPQGNPVWAPWLSIRRLLVLLVVATALPLTALLIYQLVADTRSKADRAAEMVERLADAVAHESSATLDEALRVARYLADRAGERPLDAARCDPGLPDMLRVNESFANLASFDLDGNLVCSAVRPAEGQLRNIGAPEWLARLKSGATPVVGRPQRGAISGVWIAMLAHPLHDRGGAVVGAAGVALDLAVFRPIVKAALPVGALAGIIDGDGYLVARSEAAEDRIGRNVRDTAVGRFALRGGDAPAVIVGNDGVERQYVQRRIGAHGWHAVVGVPTELIYADARRAAWRNGALAAGVLLFALLLALLVHRRIAEPLGRLGDAARDVAAGDLRRRAPENGPPEISDVAITFNRLVERIPTLERALSDSEDQYRMLFEASPDAIRVVCDNRIVMVNPAALRLYGVERPADIIGRNVVETMHPDDRERVRARMRDVLTERRVLPRDEQRVLRDDGSVVWVDTIVLPFDYQGRPALLSIARDLTERRRAEDRVRRLTDLHTALARVNEVIVRERDWQALCQAVCRITVESGGLASALVRVHDAIADTLVPYAEYGPRTGRLGEQVIGTGDAVPPAIVFRTRRTMVISDMALSDIDATARADASAQGIRSAALFPIESDQGPLGTLAVFSGEAGYFDAQLIGVLDEIAANLGFAGAKLRADRELEGIRSRMSSVVETAMDAIVSVDDSMRVTVFNRAAERMFGINAQDILGRSMDRLLPYGYRGRHTGWMRLFGEGQMSSTRAMGSPGAVTALRVDGTEFPVEATISRAEVNGALLYTVILRDISARVAAERRIVRLTALYSALSRTNEAVVRLQDWSALCETVCRVLVREGGVLAARIFLPADDGRSLHAVAAFPGELPESIDAGDPHDPVARAWRAALSTSGAPHAGTTGGTSLEAPVRLNGAPLGILSVHADASDPFDAEMARLADEMASDLAFAHEKIAAEARLRDSERRYRTLVEAALGGIVVLDGTRIEYANPGFLRMIGLDAGTDLAGASALEHIAPQFRDRVDRNIRRMMAAEVDIMPAGLLRMLHRSGRIIEVRTSAVASETSGRRRVTVEMQEVTRERRALAELRALNASLEQRIARRTRDLSTVNAALKSANRDLESFSYSVAHDLRGPLRSMMGFAQLMKLDVDAGSLGELPAHVERILRSGTRMNLLIDGLLAVARANHGALTMVPVDFSALVEDVLANLDITPQGAVCVGSLPVMQCDANALRQVWANLVSNAVKYSARKARPRIEIRSMVVDSEVRFEMQDNGAGFDPRYAQHLFEVFHRLHDARDFAGTGVGLTVVRRIIERHGGRVWAEGRPGEGATFGFALPIERLVRDP